MRNVLLIIAIIAISVQAQDSPVQATAKTSRVLWEYKVATAYYDHEEDERLAKLFADGWELVSVAYVEALGTGKSEHPVLASQAKLAPHLRYYFKRLKEQ